MSNARVLRELGASRRRHRLQDIHWSDAVYRVYVLVVAVGGMVWWIATMLGQHRIAAHSYAHVMTRTAQSVGMALAVTLLLAMRSGLRGGPLAIESAELAHVLLSPLDRTAALRRSVTATYRRGAFLGGVVGGIAGRLAVPFVAGNRVVWSLGGAGVGALLGVVWMATAMTVSGRHLPRPVQLLGVAAVAWSLVDLLQNRTTSPLTWLGRSAVAPLRGVRVRGAVVLGHPSEPVLALAALTAVALAIALLGLVSCGGVAIEQAERRAALVSQMKFAVTTQDLRAALLVRRQLGAEQLRARPRFTVRGRAGAEAAVVVRGLRSVARWPTNRIIRVATAAVVAALCARLAYRGALPVVVVPGLAGFFAGLDSAEPLSQDADHPGLLASLPRHRGRLANRQVIVPAAVLAIVGAIVSVAVSLVLEVVWHDGSLTAYVVMSVVLGALWGVAGAIAAAVSVAVGPPPLTVMVQTPEVAFLRTIATPLVSVLATAIPVLFARSALHRHDLPVAAAVRGCVFGIVVLYGALAVLTSGGVRDPDRV